MECNKPDSWEEKREKIIKDLIYEGQKFKRESIQKWEQEIKEKKPN